MYTVYKLVHKNTGLTYVGMTKHTLEVRVGQHFADCRKRDLKFYLFLRNTTFTDWVYEVIQRIEDYQGARDCEIYHIKLWDLYEKGLNEKTGSGPKSEGRKAASERLKAYRRANPEPWNKGRKGHLTEEARKLMSLAKLKNPSRRTWTVEQKNELSSKYGSKVVCLETGIVFQSISKAANFHGLRRECVRDVVNGRRSHTSGKIFKKL